MTIQQQLEKLNQTFEQMHRDFMQLDSEKAALDSRYSVDKSDICAKVSEEKERLEALKEDILTYYRIAEENSRKVLDKSAQPKKPDIGMLRLLAEMINDRSRDDPMADQVIAFASSYMAYVENELRRLSGREACEIRESESRKAQEAARIVQKKKQILTECERYLGGDDIKKLVSLFEAIHCDYEITEQYFTEFGGSMKRKRMMLIGFRQFQVDVPQTLSGTLKKSLGHHFNEKTRNVNQPVGFTTDSHEDISVEYTDLNEMYVKQGIQALILNFMRYFPLTEFRVSVFDSIHYNADLLGPLAAIAGGKNAVIADVASNDAALKQGVTILADYYKKVEMKVGVSTVYEYNKHCKPEDRIPIRLVIVNRKQENFYSTDQSEMDYIVNNAEKFGITVVCMQKSMDGGSKETKREKKFVSGRANYLCIISDAKGSFYIDQASEWVPFQWLSAPTALPDSFVAKVNAASKPVELGTRYFDRYKYKVPSRSEGKRRPISVPFGVTQEDQVVSCSFENELFAAYIMGASRSGKSTLLHTIISGLIMNYHPDELELWLLDFKMMEFKRYVNHKPPHVKYLLLEKSADLVFDIIDQLEKIVSQRNHTFAQNGWQKLSDVPADVYMPVIFVIIDEFAQMSQILKETKGQGYDLDYAQKLANLLQMGGAAGLKFIFASQTYTDGVEGLTEPARKQIQQRLALKNTYQEIKDTLELTGDAITPALQRDISSLLPFESLFKWRTDDGEIRVDRLRNMYTTDDEVSRLVDTIAAAISVSNNNCKDKSPVLLDGNQPKSFASQIDYYKAYECALDKEDLDENDILIYPGVPCSFNLARPFILGDGTSENILLAGGDRENIVSVFLSLARSYVRSKNGIEIWAHTKAPIYKKYKTTVLAKYRQRTELREICSEIAKIKEEIQNRKNDRRMILVLGYQALSDDMELLGSDGEKSVQETTPVPRPSNSGMDLAEVMKRARQCADKEEAARMIAEYNAQMTSTQTTPAQEMTAVKIYDARADVQWILKRAPAYGVHFVFAFEQVKDFQNANMDAKAFQHKLLFAMSKDDSYELTGSKRANEVEAGKCLYSNGKDCYSLRPHIYRGVPCNGWLTILEKSCKGDRFV